MTKKKLANDEIAVGDSVIKVDPEVTYSVTLASAVRFLGQWHCPSDRNITFRGDALRVVAAGAREGAIVDVTPLQ